VNVNGSNATMNLDAYVDAGGGNGTAYNVSYSFLYNAANVEIASNIFINMTNYETGMLASKNFLTMQTNLMATSIAIPVTTSWNYAAKANDWAVYSIEVDINGTLNPLRYQKLVFTDLAPINATQFFLNTSRYDNTTASPTWDTMDNWALNNTQAFWVNNTVTSPIINFNFTLPVDVSLESAYTQGNVEAMIAPLLTGGIIIYKAVDVDINGKNVTFTLDTSISVIEMSYEQNTITNYTFSILYNAENLLNASWSFVNRSVYENSVLKATYNTTKEMHLVTTSIRATPPEDENPEPPAVQWVPAFPIEWVIIATIVAAVFLARRKMRCIR
ncbi:MAG: hypothetical protein RBG13Loki_3647, partial [Promethearchaeota archaeon CR_4]